MFVGIAIAPAITCVGIACAITIEICWTTLRSSPLPQSRQQNHDRADDDLGAYRKHDDDHHDGKVQALA